MNWKEIKNKNPLRLYIGDIPKERPQYRTYIGLSINHNDGKHIPHNILNPIPLEDNSVELIQAEDVFEHIEYEKLPKVIDEIYRVLNPGGMFRLSIPDYRCDFLINRTKKDAQGNLQFDPGGGGKFVNGKVVAGGHVWFPLYENVKSLTENTKFNSEGKVDFLHYYDENGKSVTNKIDYSKGFVERTPDHDDRVKKPYRAMSLVVDFYKN